MFEKEEYAKACTEVLEILKVVKQEDLEKIPNSEIESLKQNASVDYKFSYDSQIDIKQQNVSKLTKAIIANFFIEYIASPNQKQKILDKQKYDIEALEKEKFDKYNSNEIFQNKNYNNTVSSSENLPIEVRKENVFTKIIRIIKKFLKIG